MGALRYGYRKFTYCVIHRSKGARNGTDACGVGGTIQPLSEVKLYNRSYTNCPERGQLTPTGADRRVDRPPRGAHGGLEGLDQGDSRTRSVRTPHSATARRRSSWRTSPLSAAPRDCQPGTLSRDSDGRRQARGCVTIARRIALLATDRAAANPLQPAETPGIPLIDRIGTHVA